MMCIILWRDLHFKVFTFELETESVLTCYSIIKVVVQKGFYLLHFMVFASYIIVKWNKIWIYVHMDTTLSKTTPHPMWFFCVCMWYVGMWSLQHWSNIIPVPMDDPYSTLSSVFIGTMTSVEFFQTNTNKIQIPCIGQISLKVSKHNQTVSIARQF